MPDDPADAHGQGQEDAIRDVNAGLVDDLIAPRLQREREAAHVCLDCDAHAYRINEFERVQAVNQRLRATLRAAAEKFREYERRYMANYEEAGRRSRVVSTVLLDKAAENGLLADLCEHALQASA